MDHELVIVDVSDPSAPHEIGSYDELDVSGSAVQGDLAFVTGGLDGWLDGHTDDWLYVVDVSDAANPELLAKLQTEDSYSSLAIAGERLFLAGSGSVYVVDTSVLANLKIDASLPIEAHSIAAKGDFAFAAAGQTGLRLIDASAADQAHESGSYRYLTEVRGVALYEQILYVLEQDAELVLFDISDPTAPVEAGRIAAPPGASYRRPLLHHDNWLFVHEDVDNVVQDVLHVYDLSDPLHPVLVADIEGATYATNFELVWPRLYVADIVIPPGGPGPQILDISDPTAPQLLGRVPLPPEVAIFDLEAMPSGYLFLSYRCDSGRCLTVVDATDPAAAVEVGADESRRGGPILEAYRHHVYATFSTQYGHSSVTVTSAVDPTNPKGVGGITLVEYGYPSMLEIARDHLYLGNMQTGASFVSRGLEIYLSLDPANPRLLGSYNAGTPRDVFVTASHVYLADGKGGLAILPAPPTPAPFYCR